MTLSIVASQRRHGSISIRPFCASDIPEIAALQETIFPDESGLSSTELQNYIADIFLNNPWYDAEMPSLVCEEGDKVIGFLGVLQRVMWAGNRKIRVAVSSQFNVHPERRSSGAAIGLVKAFLSGPQDLSFTDGATDDAQRLLELAGAISPLLYDMHWLRILRPAAFARNWIGKYPYIGSAARIASWLFRSADSVLSCFSSNPFAVRKTEEDEPLAPDELLECIRRFSSRYTLRPEYTGTTIHWLLSMAAKKDPPSTLRVQGVRGPDGQIAGWYIYYLTPGGISQVLQLGAGRRHTGMVLDHLFNDAFTHGSVALAGRMERDFARQLWARRAVFVLQGAKFACRSRDPEVVQAINTGDAFLTRLEGEWWMRFHERAKKILGSHPRKDTVAAALAEPANLVGNQAN